MKDIGEATAVLGVKIIRKDDKIMLSQKHYVEELLKNLDSMMSYHWVLHLIDANIQLNTNRNDLITQSESAHIIGNLTHLINFSRLG